jgi:thioredoxin-like negative regulator of GroEL
MLFITREDELKMDLHLLALYFYASQMPFHTKLVTMIEKIEGKYRDIHFFAIDVDQFNSQCKRFLVNFVPTIILLKDELEVKRLGGVVLISVFNAAFDDICTS